MTAKTMPRMKLKQNHPSRGRHNKDDGDGSCCSSCCSCTCIIKLIYFVAVGMFAHSFMLRFQSPGQDIVSLGTESPAAAAAISSNKGTTAAPAAAKTAAPATTTPPAPIINVIAITSSPEYEPAPAEDYILKHMEDLKLTARPPQMVRTCQLWKEYNSWPFYKDLTLYRKGLEEYNQKVAAFRLNNVTDIRQHLSVGDPVSANANNNIKVCERLEVHPSGGISALFSSRQLSKSTTYGYLEPLLPPLRHPDLCLKGNYAVMNQQFFVHDFAALCQKLRPSSRTIFVDLGASLFFKEGQPSPTIVLLDLYRQFGFQFDHIYAYEHAPQAADQVFRKIPRPYQASYHWINVGIETAPFSDRNPFKLLLDHYRERDLVVVKIDTDIFPQEKELVNQILADPRLQRLIDHLYFEPHSNIAEMSPFWDGSKVADSVNDTMLVFNELRRKGVAAHFWV